jgi:hypothetical protein
VPEEPGIPRNQTETVEERFERRLHHIEQEVLRENRWWRGGLIAALVLLAFSMLVAGHHRHRQPPRMAMGMAAQGMMPYGGYGPYPPRPGFGWGGPCGPAPGYGWGPGQWGGQPRQWGGPGPQTAPDQAPQPDQPAPNH